MLNVLVVDDHEDTVELLSFCLERAGHRVTAATTGANAIELARTTGFDAAVIDIEIPEHDGYAIARAFAAGAAETRPLLVALSGRTGAEDATRAVEAGFDVYLTKPVDLERLVRALADRSRKDADK